MEDRLMSSFKGFKKPRFKHRVDRKSYYRLLISKHKEFRNNTYK